MQERFPSQRTLHQTLNAVQDYFKLVNLWLFNYVKAIQITIHAKSSWQKPASFDTLSDSSIYEELKEFKYALIL